MFQVLEIALKGRILRLAGSQWLRIANERSSIASRVNGGDKYMVYEW